MEVRGKVVFIKEVYIVADLFINLHSLIKAESMLTYLSKCFHFICML